MMITSFVGCGGSPSISVLPSTDSFDQQGSEVTAKMDILWVMDVSGSMLPYQAELKDKFESFITEFVGKGYDYRMAVTTSDAAMTRSDYQDVTFMMNSSLCDGGTPRNVTASSKFLDGNHYDGLSGHPLLISDAPSIDFSLTSAVNGDVDSSDDVETVFGKNIGQGACGTGQEAGLESMRTALDNPDNASFNFPRADAHLAIIVVSDEEDSQLDGFNPSDYKAYLDIKAPFGWSFHTIGVLEDEKVNNGEYPTDAEEIAAKESSPCYSTDPTGSQGSETYFAGTANEVTYHTTLFSAASEGLRYIDLSEQSDGIVASICTPFDVTLQNIAQTIIETTVEFKLSGVPPEDPAAVQVFVKAAGVEDFPDTPVANNTENGWSYNATANSIVFHGTAIPAQGSSIKVTYDPESL